MSDHGSITRHAPRLGRRALLAGACAAGTFAGLARPLTRLVAQDRGPARRILLCELNGGWDVLLGPDPRDPSRRYPGIDLGTELLAVGDREPLEVTAAGQTALWGPTMSALVPHADVTTIFRGVNMSTVAHPTGQAYANTCILPSGTQARGSSLGAVFASAALGAGAPILPFVAIGTRAYNEGLPREASALRLARARDLSAMLAGAPRQLPTAIEALLGAAQADAESCIGASYRESPALEQEIARERLARIRTEDFASRFAFDADEPAMDAVRARYGLAAGATDRLPAVRGATAVHLLKTGLAHAVSVRLQEGFDTHTNWSTVQPQRQRAAFEALSAMVSDLREDDPALERTTVLVFSDFARTPRLNGNQGRDHWFAGSMIVLGGLRPGVVGATNEDDLGLVRLDPTTLRPTTDSAGLQLKPEHVAATVVAAAGLDPAAYRVEPLTRLLP